jgi:hypothetical protein
MMRCRLTCALSAWLLTVACAGCATASGSQAVGPPGDHVSYQGYGRPAIVSVDGRTVTVGGFAAGTCGITVRAVARENATRVALFLESSVPANPPSCPNAMASVVTAQDIRLTEPLGSRKLTDGATGRAIEWISARLVLMPTALPPGYPLSELIPAGTLRLTLSQTPAGCVQLYTSRTNPDELVIGQSTGNVQLGGSGQGAWVRIQVRGHPGMAARNVITWRENGLTNYISVETAANSAEPQVLSTQQLIAIADSAPAYNTAPLPVPR